MFAIAVFMLPAWQGIAFAKTVTRPYVMLTSQWQQWNIFSPDPLRKVSMYRLDMLNANDHHETVLFIDSTSLRWHEREKELKILGRVESEWKELAPSYIRSLCPRIPAAAGRPVYLVAYSMVMPADNRKLRGLSNWDPDVRERTLGSAICPPSDR